MAWVTPDFWRKHAARLQELADGYRELAANPDFERWRDEHLADAARLENAVADALEWAKREEERESRDERAN